MYWLFCVGEVALSKQCKQSFRAPRIISLYLRTSFILTHICQSLSELYGPDCSTKDAFQKFESHMGARAMQMGVPRISSACAQPVCNFAAKSSTILTHICAYRIATCIFRPRVLALAGPSEPQCPFGPADFGFSSTLAGLFTIIEGYNASPWNSCGNICRIRHDTEIIRGLFQSSRLQHSPIIPERGSSSQN